MRNFKQSVKYRKKKLICVLVALMATILIGCSKVESVNEANKSMFLIIETTSAWSVVYHRETKVMYAVSYGGYNCGTFTLLVDQDGKPLLYEE